MKGKKRLVANLILVGGACTLLVGCSTGGKNSTKAANVTVNTTGFPIVNKPITITMYGEQKALNGPWDKMLMFQKYQKMTNVNVKFTTVPKSGYPQKLSLWFASNQLPDAFFRGAVTPTDIVKYGKDGDLIPLDPLLKKYAPNIDKLLTQYPSIKKQITAPDGHIYALPDFVTLLDARTEKWWLNESWLKALNLQTPTTTSQLTSVLEQFKKAHPDSVPLNGRDLTDVINSMSGAWGLQHQLGNDINLQNGQAHVWLADPAFENELKYLHTLWQKGLLNHQILTQTLAQWDSTMSSGKTGLFFNQASGPFTTVAKDYVGIAPVAGPSGDRMENAAPIDRDLGTFAITKSDPYPGATLRWVDYFYSSQGSIFFRYGVKGKTYNMVNGKPQYVSSITNSSKGEAEAIGQMTPWPGGGTPEWINNQNSSAIDTPEDQKATQVLKPYIPKTIYGSPLFTAQESQQLQSINQDLTTYVQDAEAKFVSGQWSFNQWPQYVANLKKLHVDQLQQIYQSAYSRMQKGN